MFPLSILTLFNANLIESVCTSINILELRTCFTPSSLKISTTFLIDIMHLILVLLFLFFLIVFILLKIATRGILELILGGLSSTGRFCRNLFLVRSWRPNGPEGSVYGLSRLRNFLIWLLKLLLLLLFFETLLVSFKLRVWVHWILSYLYSYFGLVGRCRVSWLYFVCIFSTWTNIRFRFFITINHFFFSSYHI